MWLLVIIAVILIIWFAPRVLNTGVRKPAQSQNAGIYIIETSTETREYDINSYRYDGLARPQYKITYADEDGVVTDREIYIHNFYKRGGVAYFQCWCFLRDEKRTFRSDRILDTVNLSTNRRIKDLYAYIMR